jgi:hypothetical protein
MFTPSAKPRGPRAEEARSLIVFQFETAGKVILSEAKDP